MLKRAAEWYGPRAAVIGVGLLSSALFFLLLWFLHHAPPGPMMTPDSKDYIEYFPYRGAGYPLFIRLVGLSHLLVVQVGLYWLSLCVLTACIYKVSRNLALALATLIPIAANPFVFDNVATIASEALWLPLLVGLLALLALFMARPGAWLALGIGILAGLLCATRPTGWAIVAALALSSQAAPPPTWRERLTWLAAILIPVMLIILADGIYNRAVHGDAVTSLAGQHLYAKAAMLDTPPGAAPTDMAERRLVLGLEQDFAPVRALIAGAPNGASRMRLQASYESCAADACGDLVRNGTSLARPAANRASMRAAAHRLRRDPAGLLFLDWRDYWADWSVFHDPSLTPAFNDYMARRRPAPYEALMCAALDPVSRSRFGALGNFVFQIMAWITLAETVVLVWLTISVAASTARVRVALAAAALVQFALVMCALTAPPVSRFLVAVWPALMVACVFLAFAALETERARALSARYLRPMLT